MTSSLAAIPADKRRQVAATLGLFAVLFTAVGVLAATDASTALVTTFVVVALVVAVVLALIAWGLLRSVRLDATEQRLDAAIEQAVRAHGGSMCDCGHDHDASEMHVVAADAAADACSHDGVGADCAHTCDTCVLAAMRPSPNVARATRAQTVGEPSSP